MTNYSNYVYLLSYPSLSWYQEVSQKTDCERLVKFQEALKGKELWEMEELFTSTFDIQGICCLDVGHVLFGDDYKRAEFLVGMASLEAQLGIHAGTELSDHLPTMLKVLSVMPDNDMKIEMLSSALIPAVSKMLESFPNSDDRSNPYKFVFQGLLAQLKTEINIQKAWGPVERPL